MSARPIPRRPGTPESASALIVTLGVLALLSLIAFTFASLANLERRVSRNYVDTARARLLAQSGIDYALFRLRDPATAEEWSRYGGEDWNGDYVSLTSPGADAPTDDAQGNENSVCDAVNAPLRCARRPSFWVYPGAPTLPLGAPTLITVDEGRGPRLRGYTGRLPGTYNVDGDHYVVRVRDTSGQIFLNDRNPNLATMINYLGIELGLAADCGTRIIARRQLKFPVPQSSGFPMKDYLYNPQAPTVQDPLTKVEYDALEGYLAAHSWVDNSTLKPKPQTFALPSITTFTNSTPGYRPRKTSSTVGPAQWDYTLRAEPRAPVNLATATRPVVVALLRGVAARMVDIYANSYAYPADGSVPSPGWFEGYRYVVSTPISQAQAQTAADRIVSYSKGQPTYSITYRGAVKTGPFGTWEEFEEFVDQQLRAPAGPLTVEQAEAVKANANPNADMNKFNPDSSLKRLCDKSDLTYYTNEFCFFSTGYFEIASLGRVLGDAPANRVVAQAEIRTVVQIYEVMRHTTQKDFQSASVYSTTVPGSSQDTRRMAYYPEHPQDRGGTTARECGDTGAWNPGPAGYADASKPTSLNDPPDFEFDGQIGIAPTYQGGSPYWYMQFWDQLPGSNPLNGQRTQIGAEGDSGTWYFLNLDNAAISSYRCRDDVTANSAGPTASDPNNASLFRAYPNCSDLAQDGLIISADRYRHLVMSSLPHNYLSEGAAELWVKPKTNITDNNYKGYWWEENIYQGPKVFNVVTMGYGGPGFVTNPGYLWPYAVPYNQWPLPNLVAWGYNHEVSIKTRSYLGSTQDKIWYRVIFNPCFVGTLTTPYNTGYVPNALSYVTNTVIWGDPPKPANAGGPKWFAGQWYRMMVHWNMTTASFNLVNNPMWDSTAETQITFMDPDLYLDGVFPQNYQKQRHFNHLQLPFVYVGGYYVLKDPPSGPPDPVSALYIHYLSLNGDAEYGNRMMPGSCFINYTVNPFSSTWNGWNLDPFCEGTIDEVRLWDSSDPPTSNEITFPGDRYWPTGSGTYPRYVGCFYRRNRNPFTSTSPTTPKWDDDPTRTFPAAGTTATIRSIAYTERRPKYSYRDTTPNDNQADLIPEASRPNFDLAFRTFGSGGYDPAPVSWDGREQAFSTLIGVASPADPKCVFTGTETLEYRVLPVDNADAWVTPSRLSPYFDDITITYTVGTGAPRFLEWYYAAD